MLVHGLGSRLVGRSLMAGRVSVWHGREECRREGNGGGRSAGWRGKQKGEMRGAGVAAVELMSLLSGCCRWNKRSGRDCGVGAGAVAAAFSGLQVCVASGNRLWMVQSTIASFKSSYAPTYLDWAALLVPQCGDWPSVWSYPRLVAVRFYKTGLARSWTPQPKVRPSVPTPGPTDFHLRPRLHSSASAAAFSFSQLWLCGLDRPLQPNRFHRLVSTSSESESFHSPLAVNM